MNARCYYCDFPIRKIDGKTEKVRPIFVPAFTEGYEYDEKVLAHPSCTRDHQ